METGGRRRRRVGDGGTPGGSDDDQARLQRVKSRRVARTASDQRLAVSVTLAASPLDHRVIRPPPSPPVTATAPNGADIHTAPISVPYPTATATAAGPAAAAAARSGSTVKRSRPHPSKKAISFQIRRCRSRSAARAVSRKRAPFFLAHAAKMDPRTRSKNSCSITKSSDSLSHSCSRPRHAPSRRRHGDSGSASRGGRRPPAQRNRAAGRHSAPRGRRPVGRRGGERNGSQPSRGGARGWPLIHWPHEPGTMDNYWLCRTGTEEIFSAAVPRTCPKQ